MKPLAFRSSVLLYVSLTLMPACTGDKSSTETGDGDSTETGSDSDSGQTYYQCVSGMQLNETAWELPDGAELVDG